MKQKPPKTLVIIAGVPAELSKHLTKNIRSIEEGRRRLIWLQTTTPGTYDQSYVMDLYARFTKSLREIFVDGKSGFKLPEKFAGVLTVYLHLKRSELVTDFFEIETLALPIKEPTLLRHGRNTPNHARQSANDFVRELRKIIKNGEKALNAIGNEINSNDNRTPLLLPEQNYDALEVRSLVKSVSEIVGTSDPFQALRRVTKKFEVRNPRVTLGTRQGKYFRNGRGIVFRSPGTNRHGKPEITNENHSDSCFVRGVFRLGSAYDSRFHYDCTKIKGGFPSNWSSCHRQDFVLPKRREHVNIAPNDFVR